MRRILSEEFETINDFVTIEREKTTIGISNPLFEEDNKEINLSPSNIIINESDEIQENKY